MRKSSSDFLCGLAFLAVSIAFALQMGTLEGKSLIFPRTLAAVIALGGLWFMGKGLILRRLEKNPHPHGDPVAWKLRSICSALPKFALNSASSVFCRSISALLYSTNDAISSDKTEYRFSVASTSSLRLRSNCEKAAEPKSSSALESFSS